MRLRALEIQHPDVEHRAKILRHVLLHGAAWEMSSGKTMDLFIAAAKKYKAKRLGTKAVKEKELLEDVGEHLTEEQSTAFRALAARANYLALDRPDLCFAAKELCRQFSRPTSSSIRALRRLVKYLVRRPRLTWRFDVCDSTDDATI